MEALENNTNGNCSEKKKERENNEDGLYQLSFENASIKHVIRTMFCQIIITCSMNQRSETDQVTI